MAAGVDAAITLRCNIYNWDSRTRSPVLAAIAVPHGLQNLEVTIAAGNNRIYGPLCEFNTIKWKMMWCYQVTIKCFAPLGNLPTEICGLSHACFLSLSPLLWKNMTLKKMEQPRINLIAHNTVGKGHIIQDTEVAIRYRDSLSGKRHLFISLMSFSSIICKLPCSNWWLTNQRLHLLVNRADTVLSNCDGGISLSLDLRCILSLLFFKCNIRGQILHNSWKQEVQKISSRYYTLSAVW